MIHKDKGDYDRALEFALKALKIREHILDKTHPDLAISYFNLANTYYEIGEKQKAYDYICKAVEIWQKTLPARHPHLLRALKFKEYLESEFGIV